MIAGTVSGVAYQQLEIVDPDGLWTFHEGNSLEAYAGWDAPDTIISDGAYGVRGFRGDTVDTTGLVDWYQPHVLEWSRHVKPSTSLWFWNTEVGWATVHPLLLAHGWEYVELITWDKGLSHIAGNVNGNTIRQMPVVTEVSALYRRRLELQTSDGRSLSVKEWLRHEWQRSGLPLSKSNEACGVKNAATRKYLTQDWLWYWPPGEMVEKMATFARLNGRMSSRPYFSLDGDTPITAQVWDGLRSTWNHAHGLTNVWSRPPLHDGERLKGAMERSAPRTYKPTRASATHLNQKPLEFMVRQVEATTNPGEAVWEPFGGLASASVAAVSTGRRAFASEIDVAFQGLACERLAEAADAARASSADRGRVDLDELSEYRHRQTEDRADDD